MHAGSRRHLHLLQQQNISTDSGPNMANQVVRLWEAVLANLAEMASSTTDPDAFSKHMGVLAKIRSLPDPPKAIWKRVIQDMQVRDRAGSQHSQHTTRRHTHACLCWALTPLLCMLH
jgi:plasmid stabilization system protein ParE